MPWLSICTIFTHLSMVLCCKLTVATTQHPFQWATCISQPLLLRWTSCQDQFHSPPALLSYPNSKPIFTQRTMLPKPSPPIKWFQVVLKFITGLQNLDLLSIGISDVFTEVQLHHECLHVQSNCWLVVNSAQDRPAILCIEDPLNINFHLNHPRTCICFLSFSLIPFNCSKVHCAEMLWIQHCWKWLKCQEFLTDAFEQITIGGI